MKKSIIWLICLTILLSLTLFTLPSAEAEAASVISGKTGQGAADFALSAYNNGWKYVYGAYGQVITEDLVDGFRKTFPGMYTDSYYKKTLKAVGSRGVDCAGLLKAYLWWQGSGSNPKPTNGVAGGATAMYNEASDKGSMSTMPDEAGIILFRPGHIGIYIGGGYVVDARGVDYGVRKENNLSKWTNWFRSPYLSYSGKSGSGNGSSKSGGSSSSSSSSSSSVTLRMGDTGSNVKKLQNRLKTLGYFSGSADGDFGSQTETAVKAFQKKAGLTADGVAGQATQKKLYASDAPKADSSSKKTTASADSSSSSGSTLKLGSTGAEVTKLQNRLRDLGYFAASATGTYGELTKQAVTAFQKAVGMTATGNADQKTQTKLYASSAPKYTVNATSDVKTVKLSTAKPSKTLKRGDTGEDVKTLQTRLKALGYLTGTVDDTFGSGTETAVKEFQEAAGLTADGVAGSGTLDKLFSDSAPKKSSHTSLTLNDTGQKVTDLQNRLITLGYLKAEADGTYGQSTADAIKAFQEKAGLTADGVAGSQTQEKLFADSAPHADGAESSSEEPSSEPESSEPEPIASELPDESDDEEEGAVITEVIPSSDADTVMQDSSGMIKTILIICIVAAALVVCVIFVLERRKKTLTATSRVIRKGEDYE